MNFEWDVAKEKRNFRKHGIAFEDATQIFDLPILEGPDPRDHGEERIIALGEANGSVLVVVYTWRRTKRRIISARKATKQEREVYYREVFGNL